MSDMIIRDAVPEDAQRLLEIYAWYVEHTAISFEYETPSADEFQSRMEHIMENYPYLVVETEGVIQGYAYAGPFVGRAAYDWSCAFHMELPDGGHGSRLCGSAAVYPVDGDPQQVFL